MKLQQDSRSSQARWHKVFGFFGRVEEEKSTKAWNALKNEGMNQLDADRRKWPVALIGRYSPLTKPVFVVHLEQGSIFKWTLDQTLWYL